MDDENTRTDIRKLLKNFGIQADEAILKHVAENTSASPLHLRITLTDLTDYGDTPPASPLHLEVEGNIRL